MGRNTSVSACFAFLLNLFYEKAVILMKNIAILGSTGSIGTQTLDIVDGSNGELNVVALSAGKNIELLEEQTRKYRPDLICVETKEDAEELGIRLNDTDVRIVYGMEGLTDVASFPKSDMLVTAIVGMVGLKPTIAAIKSKKTICLANKETLVTAGHIIMPLAKEYGVDILPVDSEHSAVFQCLQGENREDVEKIILTASGGPFRGKTLEELKNVTLAQALKHPNWSMGKKITIDSATMVNKGLEVIEAKWLFGMDIDKIEVVVHPQSIIHSMVEFKDGGIKAQLGIPDMRLPIQYAITYPDRLPIKNSERLSFKECSRLDFEEPDTEVFKGLKLAFKALENGGNSSVMYNAANEYLVSMFLREKISFLDIPKYIEFAMNEGTFTENPNVDEILETEAEVKRILESEICR